MSIKGLDGREFQREAGWEKVKAAGYTDTYDGTDCGIRPHLCRKYNKSSRVSAPNSINHCADRLTKKSIIFIIK